MGVEIERKFLVDKTRWEELEKGDGLHCAQIYLVSTLDKTIRVRVIGEQAFITIKGKTENLTRSEFEYEIPLADGTALIDQFGMKQILEKRRYLIQVGVHQWEVDVFDGLNKGLIIAEIELSSETEKFEKPNWIGKEVSLDSLYYNACLQDQPYSEWETE